MTKKKVNCDYELLCLLDKKVKNAASYEHYARLKLKKEDNPSLEEIKKAYHQATLKWHPEKIQQRENQEPTKDEKNKWHEIENAYHILSDPKKKEEYDLYEGKNKYEKMIVNLENMLGGKENIKVEEKNWKPVYKINSLTGEGHYVLFYFNSEREKAKRLEEEILKSISNKGLINRYLLLNLTDEKKNKIKLIKKDAE